MRRSTQVHGIAGLLAFAVGALLLATSTSAALLPNVLYMPWVANRAPAMTITPTPGWTYTPPLTYTPPPTPTLPPTPTYTPPSAVDPALVPVLSHTTYTSPLGRHIVGEIRNEASFPIGYISIVARLYSGDTSQERFTYVFTPHVEPNQKACFNLVTEPTLTWDRYEVEVYGARGPVANRPRLSILDLTPGISPYGTLQLSGRVRNDESVPLTLVVVVGRLYDATNTLVDCVRPLDLPQIDRLAPGEIRPFTLIFGRAPNPLYTYVVEADGFRAP